MLNFKVNQIELAHVMKELAPVIERSNDIPILASVKIETTDIGVRLTTTDMDVCSAMDCDAEIIESGDICVADAKQFTKLVKNLPKGKTVEFVLTDDSLDLTCGNVSANFETMPAEDFPTHRCETETPFSTFTVMADALYSTMEKVAGAMSTEATRYYLHGIAFESNNAELRMIATDSHRMVIGNVTSEQLSDSSWEDPIIVPSKTIKLLLKQIRSAGNTDVHVDLYLDYIIFRHRDSTIMSKLIDGRFPNYTQVIPDDFTTTLTVEPEALAAAVKQIASMSMCERDISLSMGGTFSLKTVNQPTSMQVSFDADLDGPALTISLNYHYLAEMVKTFADADTVEIKLSDANAPMTWCSDDLQGLKGVLMPTPIA